MTRGRIIPFRSARAGDPPRDADAAREPALAAGTGQVAAVADDDDAAVIAGCAAGERAARAKLFERYFDAVHRFVSRMRGSDRDAVDDLVQATFLAAFRSAPRFRGGGNARSWLLGIAANLTRELSRREIRRKRALGLVAELPPREELATAERALLARLPEAIAALPHELRAAFVLVDLEGERGVAAAAALGIPEGTLWRRVFHARRQLRAKLAGGDS